MSFLYVLKVYNRPASSLTTVTAQGRSKYGSSQLDLGSSMTWRNPKARSQGALHLLSTSPGMLCLEK